LTSSLQQNDMNSINLQYIKLNNAKTYEKTPAMLKNKYSCNSDTTFYSDTTYAYVHQAFVRFLFW